MWTRKNKKEEKRGKLSREILEFLSISLITSLFTFVFLYFTSVSIAENYLYKQGISTEGIQEPFFYEWISSVCFFAAVVVFISMFLFLFGQKISYLISIIKGVETLHQNQMNSVIPLEGNDELTQLAITINDFSKAQREFNLKEKAFKEEREEMIRSLSHDIRTPLTSIISYSEYMKSKEYLKKEDMESYIRLMQTKAQQMKTLTDQLLGKNNKNIEKIENGKLLMEQLVAEWEEILEEKFQCTIDLEQCHTFKGIFAVSDLQRIFDNLASNVEKYADPNSKVELLIKSQGDKLVIIQCNGFKTSDTDHVDSCKIGINSVRQIAQDYGGEVKVIRKNKRFEIQISLNIMPSL